MRIVWCKKKENEDMKRKKKITSPKTVIDCDSEHNLFHRSLNFHGQPV